MTNKKVIIIGAGPAGLWAARTLKQNGYTPIIIEKNHQVGGKCSTFSDSTYHELKTERGAGVLTPNYGSVIDAIHEKNIRLEKKMKTNAEEIPVFQMFQNASWFTKLKLGLSITRQSIQFIRDVSKYNHAKNYSLPLPEGFDEPFSEYAQKHDMTLLCDILKPLVTAFGYGAMEECPTYAIMQYMGYGTLLYLLIDQLISNSSLLGIENGFQSLMEKVAEDFDVILDASVSNIKRNSSGVDVTYSSPSGDAETIHADAMVLAISPINWKSIGLDMTTTEQLCCDNMSYYRYPIAVCDVEGLPPEILYKQDGLCQEGYGKLSLITTRDNRLDTHTTDGRLCTVYLNLPQGATPFEFNSETIEQLKNQIFEIPGVTRVKFLEYKIWEDYMPTLPWDLRLALEKEQMSKNTNTLYVGAYPLGGFEDVACVTEQAKTAVEKYIVNQNDSSILNHFENKVKDVYRNIGRSITFYRIPRVDAVNETQSYETRFANGT